MKNNWQKVRVGDVVDIRRGSSPRPIDDFISNSGMPWVKISDATSTDSRYIKSTKQYIKEVGVKNSVIVKPEDLIISNSATPALPRVMKIEACVHDGWLVVSNYHGIDRDFLFYAIVFYRKWLLNQGNGSIFKNLKTDILKDFIILLPPMITQKGVAELLVNIDERIELNNRINEELEQAAQLIYDYWFVQYDFPNENGKPYKTSGGSLKYSTELKREIPNSWKTVTLKQIAKVIMGQSPKGSSYNENNIGVPLLNGPADYENGSLVGRIFTTEPTRLCVKNDLVLCIRATIGNLTYAEKEFCLGRGVAAVSVNDTSMSELIYFALLQEIERFKIQATGSIIVGITKDDLTDSIILQPDQELLSKFHDITQPFFDKIRINKAENLDLVRLRDWLLPMLMTGQVTIGE